MPDAPLPDDSLEVTRTRAFRLIDVAESEGYLTPINALEHRAFVDEAREGAVIDRLIAGMRLPEHLALIPLASTPIDRIETVTAEPISEPTFERISTSFGSEERKGRWTVPETMELDAFAGSIVLDLRGAFITSDVLEIDYSVLLGSIEIIVPPGVEVSARNETWLGSFEHQALVSADPVGAGFVLRLRGTNRMGSVEVIEKEMPTGENTLATVKRWLKGG